MIKGRELFKCKRCYYQTSLTAGTVLHRTRTPLLVWFWAIFLISCDKRGHSSLSLSKELGVAETEDRDSRKAEAEGVRSRRKAEGVTP